MNMYEQFFNIELKTPVGNNQPSDTEDVKQTRKTLNSLGIDSGDIERGYIDRDLDGAIREFQKDMDLKQDGLIKPKGETEKAINNVLSSAKESLKNEHENQEFEKKRKIENLKELKDNTSVLKNFYDMIKKRNPAKFMKDLSERTKEIHENDKNGPI